MISPDQQRELLRVGEEAARAGAAELLAWRNRFAAREKGPADLVTDADLASEKAVTAVLGQHFPNHAILGEEGTSGPDQIRAMLAEEYCWVVDPLDGTTNYVHQFPCFAVSIGLACQGHLVAGVVYDPLADEMFAATRGGGATLNGTPISVSDVRTIGEALVAVSFPPAVTEQSPDMQAFLRTAPVCQAVRRTGSAALNLAYVACGRLEAHWAYRIRPWDAAAGVLLVEEAGGVATASRGGPFCLADADYFVANSTSLHRDLRSLIEGRSAGSASR